MEDNEVYLSPVAANFFNEEPPAGYYKPYVYPHPLQEGWEALMKSVAASAVSTGGSMKPSAASKP